MLSLPMQDTRGTSKLRGEPPAHRVTFDGPGERAHRNASPNRLRSVTCAFPSSLSPAACAADESPHTAACLGKRCGESEAEFYQLLQCSPRSSAYNVSIC